MKAILATCMFMMTTHLSAEDPVSKIFRSQYANHDVAIQADPQSSFWKDVPPIYAEVDNHGQTVPDHRTEIRSRWTTQNLYILFVCPFQELYLKPAPNVVAETNQLWNWDVAELFIGNDFKNIRRYKEFELSPQGEWIDLDINLDLPDHTVGWIWNSGFTVAAHIDHRNRIWYGEMKIPFSAITQDTPKGGTFFRANLFRGQGPPERKKAIAWKAPMNDTFHTPERFGKLVLEK